MTTPAPQFLEYCPMTLHRIIYAKHHVLPVCCQKITLEETLLIQQYLQSKEKMQQHQEDEFVVSRMITTMAKINDKLWHLYNRSQ